MGPRRRKFRESDTFNNFIQKMALNDRQVVIIVPDGWTNFNMMELKHPKSKTGKMFAMNAEKTDLAEVISIDDPYAAWFIGDTVEPDGRLQMLTPDKMNKVANSKGTPDLNVWQWNESKTLEY